MTSGEQELKDRIARVLSSDLGSEGVQGLSVDHLVQEISIYHQELEYQNLELHRVNVHLEESRAQLKDLFDQAPFAYAVVDREVVILQGNKTLEEVLGLASGQVTGKNLTQFISPESQNRFYFFFNNLLKGDGPDEISIEMVSNREIRTFKVRGNLLKEGHQVLARLSLNDITWEIQSLQRKKLESIGLLAGGVAHDFNNTLAIISGKTEMALLNLHNPELLEKDLNVILSATRHGADITRNLLTFARKQAVNPRILDLEKETEEYLPILRQLVEESVELRWAGGCGSLPVFLDPVQYRQVLINLTANARDSMENDYGVIEVSVGRTDGGEIWVRVADNGRGMDAFTQEKMFDPFFTTKGVGKGTGLGMATVQGIVVMNKGRISVDSKPGEGTKVTLFWPEYQGGEHQITEESSPGIPREKSFHVLLVEDREELRLLTADFLRHLGHRVVSFANPINARDEVLSSPGDFDLMVTDVVMPGISGPELYKAVSKIQPAMKVVFMTGYSAGALEAHGLDCHNFRILPKPFTMAELAKAVDEVCG